LRTAGTPWDNLPPRASSELRAVVTKGSRTAETALYSSPGMQEAVQDGHEGSGAQQRDGALQSNTESSPEGIADLHRVTLAARVICQMRGRLHHLGSDPSHVGRPYTGRRWPDRRSRQLRPSGHDTPSGLAVASRRYHWPPAPRRRWARPGQAQRGDRMAPRQPVAAGPGRNQAGRDGEVQDRRWSDPSGRVRPGAA
jgi:hypothetical protein